MKFEKYTEYLEDQNVLSSIFHVYKLIIFKIFKKNLFVQGKLKKEGDARIIELKIESRADVLLTVHPNSNFFSFNLN